MGRLTPQGSLKIKNKKAILDNLFEKGAMSRADLALLLDTTKTTISKNVKELLEQDILCEIGKGDNALGKKSILINFKEDLFNYIFINLVGSTLKFYILSVRGELLHKEILEDLNRYDATRIVEENLKNSDKNIKHVILSMPGVVKENDITANREIYKELFFSFTSVCNTYNINLSVINDIDFQTEYINKKYNDKNKNLIVIGADYGLGASIILNNNLFKGENNFAGEIGFLNPKVVDGEIQTMESRCSVVGLLEAYYNNTGEKLTPTELEKKVLEKDKILLNYIDNMVEEMVTLINNLSYSFDIQLFYLYGLLFRLDKDICKIIQEKIDFLTNRNIQIKHIMPSSNDIVVTKLFIKDNILKLID